MGTSLSREGKDRVKGAKKDGGTELNLSDIDMSKFSKQVLKFKHLVVLDLSRNHLLAVPDWIGKLQDLEDLNLSHNEIPFLPASIVRCSDLKGLNLEDNELVELPATISTLQHLVSLNIGTNRIPSLPQDFGSLKQLTTLDYSHNELDEIPKEVWQLTNLQTLIIAGNRLKEYPPQLENMKDLRTLDLSMNELTELSFTIGNLTKLENLKVNANSLELLPKRFEELVNLQDLSLDGNRLNDLSTFDLGKLTALQHLSMERNQLTHFHPGLGTLTLLRTLNLSSNLLEEFPKQIGWIAKNMRRLNISDNKLVVLPGEITMLSVSCDVDISANPLTYPFDCLYDNGPPQYTDAMRPYVKAYYKNCRAQGEGLAGSIAGIGTQFSIEAYDFRGEHRVNGKDKFSAVLRKKPVEDDFLADMDEWTQKVIVKDNEDGSYHAFYNCKVSGHMIVDVMEDGQHIPGSPFPCYIAPGETCAKECAVAGAGLQNPVTGKPVEFTLYARDRFGNNADRGNDPFTVAVVGGSNPTPVVIDNENGSYAISFVPGWPGEYICSISLLGEHIAGSPLKLTITGDAASASPLPAAAASAPTL